MLKNDHELANCNKLEKNKVIQWINNGPNSECIKEAEEFAEYIAKRLKKVQVGKKTVDESVTTSQIRHVFTKLKGIEAKGGLNSPEKRIEFLMLKPLLAYSLGRHKKTGLKQLKKRLDWGIDAVLAARDEQQKRFKHFCKLFEAILAYHKAYGGN